MCWTDEVFNPRFGKGIFCLIWFESSFLSILLHIFLDLLQFFNLFLLFLFSWAKNLINLLSFMLNLLQGHVPILKLFRYYRHQHFLILLYLVLTRFDPKMLITASFFLEQLEPRYFFRMSQVDRRENLPLSGLILLRKGSNQVFQFFKFNLRGQVGIFHKNLLSF